MTHETTFEDRVSLAVTDALVGTISYWVRGVAVRVDENEGTAEVLFASPETWVEIHNGIADFSARLDEAASDWLAHSTEFWQGHGLEDWPGRTARVVFATRVPLTDWGMDQEAEFANYAGLVIAGCMAGAFDAHMWGASFRCDAATRTVDIHLAFSREPSLLDHWRIEELVVDLESVSVATGWPMHVWVGEVEDANDWPGRRLRQILRRRDPHEVVPDDFEADWDGPDSYA